VVATLLAGRGAFRGALVFSAPLLLAAWGPATFAPYALAMGTTLVLNPLVGAGTERAAGALLPRARRTGAHVLSAHVLVTAVTSAGLLTMTVPFAVVDTDRAALWLLAGATNVGFGAVQAIVACWRALGVPWMDAAAHTTLAAVTAGGVAAAALAGAGPAEYMALQAGTAATVSGALLLGMRRRLARRLGRASRRVTRLVAGTTVLMGTNALLATAPVSVVIAAAGMRADPRQIGHLYIALTGYTVLANVVDYLQRVYQPWLTGTLTARPAAIVTPVRRTARGSLRIVTPAAALAVVACGLTLDGIAAPLAATLAVVPVLLTVALLVFVLENRRLGGLVRTTAAGLAGLAATGLAALLAVPLLATGAILALLAGAAVQLALLIPLLDRATVAGLASPTASTTNVIA
jgi:hypothetical protein